MNQKNTKIKEEPVNELYPVTFTIKLTGSKLFDLHMYVTAKNLCDKFPGLNFRYKDNEIVIEGSLNTYYFEKWQAEVFEN